MTRPQTIDAPHPQWVPCVWLASSEETDKPPSHEARTDDAAILAGRTVMIVEDETIVAMDLKFAIEDAGGVVIGPFAGLGESRAFLSGFEGQIDAAVLDVNLRGEMVFPLAADLENRGVPFLFHTANIDMPELRTSFAAYPVCNKPTKVESLTNSIATLIR